jgi:SAM-dependent methyltransferase
LSDWFDPRRLFAAGYPAGITSALRALPAVRQAVRDEARALAARRVLEIGPGDAPVADGLPDVVFLDIAPGFLRPLAGARVVADLFHAPFAPGTFDLVIAADVLTHIRPARRDEALARITELGRHLVLFNPEPGTGDVEGSRSPSQPLLEYLAQHGFSTRARRFVAAAPGGEYPMRLIVARRV